MLWENIHSIGINGHLGYMMNSGHGKENEISAHLELTFNGTKIINKLEADNNNSSPVWKNQS